MKSYVGPRNSSRKGSSSKEYKKDESVLRQACLEISRARTISDEVKDLLVKTFDRNYVEAMKLVNQNRVKRVRFVPSGRVIWVVIGRKREYQVVPQSMFCTCDDYYFRVMGQKKQLCYHLIAQHLAEALGLQSQNDLVDADYADFTAQWKPVVDSART
jgi:predicted nucleic acid-binding Zn finger protein